MKIDGKISDQDLAYLDAYYSELPIATYFYREAPFKDQVKAMPVMLVEAYAEAMKQYEQYSGEHFVCTDDDWRLGEVQRALDNTPYNWRKAYNDNN